MSSNNKSSNSNNNDSENTRLSSAHRNPTQSHKKIKISNDQQEYENIKKYIGAYQPQHCGNDAGADIDAKNVDPNANDNAVDKQYSHHSLIKAALLAVDKEFQRNERDKKLQQRFQKKSSSTTENTKAKASVNVNGEDTVDGMVVVGKNPTILEATLGENGDDEEMEWQDVQEKEMKASASTDGADLENSYLGRSLSKIAVEKISQYKQTVKSPLAAITVALHAALRSEILGFACTGVPEVVKKGGFAPSVRELPPHQFLPPAWESTSGSGGTTGNPSQISLRYRKTGTGALLLKVQVLDEEDNRDTIEIFFQAASSKEPSSQRLAISIAEYFNLDSWNTAMKNSSSVSPTLHYKSLAVLMTKFCQTFDLGAIQEATGDSDKTSTPRPVEMPSPYVDNTIRREYRSDFVPAPTPLPAAVGTGRGPYHPMPGAYRVPGTLGEAFPAAPGNDPLRVGGDFAGDLGPMGLRNPGFPSDGRMGGNLMGPNHPMFRGGIPGPAPRFGPDGGPLGGGPGSMQPRFDPIYPDGIHDFPDGQAPRARNPNRAGNPNPDHLQPPNSFNSNMFS